MQLIHIIGKLGSDPETRFTASNQKVTTFRVACNRKRAGKEETTWYRATVWGEQYDKLMPYIKKGSSLHIVGDFQQPEMYQDKEGRTQVSLQITVVHISFLPASKPAERKTEEGAPAPAHAGAFGAPYNFPSVDESSQGKGSDADASRYLDEEIAF